MDKMKIYGMLPTSWQNLACSYEGWRIKKVRYNRSFTEALRLYEGHNDWTYDRMCDYRDKKLQELIHQAYKTVPYYHKLFNDGGVNPDSIKTVDDLKQLPILKKNTIMENPRQFLSTDYTNRSLSEISTSGSTGTSLVLKVDPKNIAQQYAVWWRYRRRLGIDFDMWHNEFGSRIVVPPVQDKPPYWRCSLPLKQEMFSAYHGNADTFYSYFERMQKTKYPWIHATPSVFVPFAAFCAERGLKFDYQIKFITTGAENLYDHQRMLIKEAFDVWPRTHYGLTEAVANFSDTIDGCMEVDEDFAAVEFLPEDDFHHIIGTSLINYSMPLIRYDTADICFFSGRIGSHGRVVDKIDGRTGDGIFLPGGTHVGTLSALFSETKNIVEAQIYQHKDYSLTIRYVPKNENYVTDLKQVESMLQDRIAHAVPVNFERVDKIPRTTRGKLRYIVTELSQK